MEVVSRRYRGASTVAGMLILVCVPASAWGQRNGDAAMRREAVLPDWGREAAGPVLAGLPTALFTFGFTDLDGEFDGASTWTMRTSEMTAGDVTRGVSPFGTADFDEGFAGGVAGFSLDMTVAPSGGNWSGDGTFTITDADGDTITGDFNGNWERLTGSHAAFTGVISNVQFDPSATFDGTDGGSVSMDFAGVAMESLNGAVAVLEAGGWFSNGAFSDPNSLIIGTVVPAPGAALLGLLGLGSVAWAQRRFRRADAAAESH